MSESNRLYNIGDSLVIEVKPKQGGTATLTSYTDTLDGVSGSRGVSREFRIVEDGLFYSDWLTLNSTNIKKFTIKQNNIIQVRYTRTGSDKSGYVEFQDIVFRGDFQPAVVNSPILDKSIFSSIAWTEETETLAKNLFKKLYFRGIVPTYILRGDNLSVDEDRDYIDLFYTIAKYFAIILRFFKRFESFYDDEELMLEWLRQNEIQFDESTITLSQMQLLASNLYDEIRKRGTVMVFKRQGDVVNGKELEIDGEFIRLLRSRRCDELLYENVPIYLLGWCMQKSSPMYRGTSFSNSLNKTKESTQDFQDLSNFVHFGNAVSLYDADVKKVVKISSSGNQKSGLGRIDTSIDVTDNLYVADPFLDYEVTFMVNVQNCNDTLKLYFGVEGFDINKMKLTDAFIASDNSAVTEMFLNGVQLNKFKPNTWYLVRGIIHAYSSQSVSDAKLNIGFGNNLRFDNRFLKYILPKIYASSSGDSSIWIWDYKIRPLVRGTNILPLADGTENSHSLGFIQCPQIFYAYLRNNNNSQSQDDITDIIERYLLPFNVIDILQFLEQ